MQDTPDLDVPFSSGSVDQEMSRLADTTDFIANSISAHRKMIGPDAAGNFITCGTAWATGGLGDVNDCLNDQGFVAKPRLFAEVLVCPAKD